MLQNHTFSAFIFLKVFLVISQPTNKQILDQATCASSELLQMKMDALESKIEELSTQNSAARDCTDVYGSGGNVSGVYTINLNGIQKQVYCDLTTPGGGWLVFQRRQDGSIDFYRDWRSYQAGFGDVKGEFWLGNEFLYKLTSSNKYKLRIDMADFAGETRYGVWSTFSVRSSASNYQLSVGGYSGNAGDAMARQNQMQFSAFDRDVDIYAGNCAVDFKGAWWYKDCHESNLNGAYLMGPHTSYADGIEWEEWHGYYYSLKSTEMKIALAN